MKIAIVGGGMAGLFLCHFFLQQGENDITIYHDEQKDMASKGQSFLFHPFPGRSMEVLPCLKEAVTTTVETLSFWQKLFPETIRNKSMFRPFKGSNGARLQKSYQKWWKNAARDWVQFQEYSAQEKEATILSQYDAVSYQPAFVVDFGELRNKLFSYFSERGIRIQKQTIEIIEKKEDWWCCAEQNFDVVVLAMGTRTLQWFPNLDLTTQGGSLLQLEMHKQIGHMFSLDGLHIGEHSSGDWVVGSTRWHSWPKKEEEILRLKEKLAALFPNIEQGQTRKLWSGNRCIYPSDRNLLCGELPHQKKIFLLTALGSKGMLWGPLGAKSLVANICHSETIPKHLHVQRANFADGLFSEYIHS